MTMRLFEIGLGIYAVYIRLENGKEHLMTVAALDNKDAQQYIGHLV